MAGSLQWPLEIDDILLRALRLRAARHDADLQAVVEALLRQALAPEIEELSGAVPLADMIQQVVRRGGHARSRSPQSATA